MFKMVRKYECFNTFAIFARNALELQNVFIVCPILNPWTAREPGFERYFTSSTQETKSYARSPGTGAGLTGDFNWETEVKFPWFLGVFKAP